MQSYLFDGQAINLTDVIPLEDRRAIFPISALIIAYKIFPRSNIITLQASLKVVWRAAFPRHIHLLRH